jgi:gamma-glutamyltranspeptidase / glutathione hydrolase
MDPAVALGHGHIVNRGDVTELEEDSTALAFQPGLEALGHAVKAANLNSGLHVILIGEDGRLVGAADPRREGTVAGD